MEPVLVVLVANGTVLMAGWLLQCRVRNAGIADLLFAGSIGASAVYYGTVGPGSMLSQLLVTLMGGIWSCRLLMHLLARTLAEREDARYRHLRHASDDRRGLFLGLFTRRIACSTLYSIPLYVAASNPVAEPNFWTALAGTLFLVGFAGEAYADLQLAAFRAKPRHLGHTCRSGLWRYSRHPNYLFGLIQWCSYPLLAIGLPWPVWSLTLLGPLLSIAGWRSRIPAAEDQAIRTRGEDYLAYRAATSMVLPWFPRNWPNDQPDTSLWLTPLVPSRTATPRPGPAPARQSSPSAP